MLVVRPTHDHHHEYVDLSRCRSSFSRLSLSLYQDMHGGIVVNIHSNCGCSQHWFWRNRIKQMVPPWTHRGHLLHHLLSLRCFFPRNNRQNRRVTDRWVQQVLESFQRQGPFSQSGCFFCFRIVDIFCLNGWGH